MNDLFEPTAAQVAPTLGLDGGAPPKGAPRSPATPALAVDQQCCGNCGESTPWILSDGLDSGFVNCTHIPVWTRENARSTCAFRPSRWKPIDAKRIAQRGIDQAVAAAERAAPGWSTEAFAFVRAFAEKNRGARYIGHEIVQASIAAGVAQPQNDKAWGGPIQRAARAKVITRVGYSEDPNRHGNPVPLWETA